MSEIHPLFKKLNYKVGDIHVVNAPASFASALEPMRATAQIHDGIAKAKGVGFAIAFATKQVEVDRFAAQMARATLNDAVVWIAYPKGSSKSLTCEFNRDTGWAELGRFGFEPVRQVAIDADWSALRFRRVEYVKSLTRDPSWAISPAGKARERKAR